MRKIQTAYISTNSGLLKELSGQIGDHIEFFQFKDTDHFFGVLEDQEFDVILIDDSIFESIAQSSQFKRMMKTENVILFTNQKTATRKKEFLEDGGWMIAEGEFWKQKLAFYLEQTNHLESVIKPAIYSRNILVTSLMQNSLHDILFNAFLERKSVEVFLLGEVKNGRIIIQDGEVILAEFGSSDDFEALVRMMLLQKGIVRVIPFYGQATSYKVLPTLIAIHLESEFQKNMIENWLKTSFQSDADHIQFIWHGKKQHVFKSHNEKKLSTFLSVPRHLSQIIELIDEMPIQLLELLMKLAELGVIDVYREEVTEEEPTEIIPPATREDLIRSKLELPKDARSARLLILGLPASGKNEFIALLKGKGAEIKNVDNFFSL
jgi:hypothetical protein